jgi:uncharacterized membrane protein YbhN (UPF0104 family)
MAASLARASKGWWCLAALVALASQALQAVKLWMITRALGLHLTLPASLHIHFASLAYGLVVPGGNFTAIAVRTYRIGHGHDGMAAAGMALVADRLIAISTLAMSGLVFMPFVQVEADTLLAMVFAAIVVAGAVLLGLTALGPRRLHGAPWIERHSWAKRSVRWVSNLKPISLRCLSIALLMALLLHGLGVVSFVLIGRAADMPMSVAEIGLARAVMCVAALLPVSVAGLGLREGAAVLLLGSQGVARGPAVAFSLLAFLGGWVLPGVIGAVVEAVHLFGRRHDQARSERVTIHPNQSGPGNAGGCEKSWGERGG